MTTKKQPAIKYRMAAACRIVGADRLRMNEAMASGAFTWKVEVAVNNRLFGEKDLIGLWMFNNGLRRGYPPRMAGWLTGQFEEILTALYSDEAYWRNAISAAQRRSALLMAIGTSGNTSVGWACDRDRFELAGGEPIFQWIEVDLEPIRELIRRGIENENQLAGEDEDEGAAAKTADAALSKIFIPDRKERARAKVK